MFSVLHHSLPVVRQPEPPENSATAAAGRSKTVRGGTAPASPHFLCKERVVNCRWHIFFHVLLVASCLHSCKFGNTYKLSWVKNISTYLFILLVGQPSIRSGQSAFTPTDGPDWLSLQAKKKGQFSFLLHRHSCTLPIFTLCAGTWLTIVYCWPEVQFLHTVILEFRKIKEKFISLWAGRLQEDFWHHQPAIAQRGQSAAQRGKTIYSWALKCLVFLTDAPRV